MSGVLMLSGLLLLLAFVLALWDALTPVTGPRDEWQDGDLLTRRYSSLDRVYMCEYSPTMLLDLAAECDAMGQYEQAQWLRDVAHVQVLRVRLTPARSDAVRRVRPVWGKGRVA